MLPLKLTWDLAQTRWAAILNAFIGNVSNTSTILTQVRLTTGSNSINHRLGKNLTGWRVIRQRAAATLYDTQDLNQTPSLTLILIASAPVSVDLEVF